MSGWHLISIGIVLIITPAVIALCDVWETWTGDKDDPGIEMWLFSKPLPDILAFRLMIITGVWLIGTGALYLTLPM